MDKTMKIMEKFIIPFVSIIIAFIVGMIIMLALGVNPVQALGALFKGAFGTSASIGTTLNKATPLIFTSLCACFAYKCGVYNLGGEGQFLFGATTAFCILHISKIQGIPGIITSMLVGIIAGGVWGLIPGILKITRGLNEMIISIMLNYISTLFMGVIYTSWIRDANMPQTPSVDNSLMLSKVIPGMRFTWSFIFAIMVGLLMYYGLYWTSKGFKLRAVGLNMTAAKFNGFAVKKYILISFILSGAVAGLGGAADLLGTQYRLINGYGSGYGFDGVAIALIAQLHPIAAIIVSIFFAALRVGSTSMQVATGVPTSVSDIIQALVIVFSVAGMALTKLPEFEMFRLKYLTKKVEGKV